MDEAFAAELEGVRWFAAVGQPLPGDLPFGPLHVSSWGEGVEYYADPTWDDVQLRARNELSLFLGTLHRPRFQQWNEVAREAKTRVVEPLAASVWRPFADRHGLGRGFVGAVKWDVLAAIMEHEYRDCHGRPAFFLELLQVYRAGHVPCGWFEEWPVGRIVVW